MPVCDLFLIFLSSVLVSQKKFGAIGSEVPKNKRPKEEEYCSEFLDVSTLNQDSKPLVQAAPQPDPEALSFNWTFWYDSSSSPKKVSRKDYLATLTRLATISTLPAFFTEWKKISPKLLQNQTETNIRFFRDNIMPMWEDASNSNGGKWVIVFRQRPSQRAIQMLQSLLISLMIGDLGHEDDLCGAVLSIRTWGFMYTLWNKNSENHAQIEEISRKLAEIFSTPKIKYQSHKDAIQKTSHEARQQKEAEIKERRLQKLLKVKQNQPKQPTLQTNPERIEESSSSQETSAESLDVSNSPPQDTQLNAGYVSSDSESGDPALPSFEAEGNQPILSIAEETASIKKREVVLLPLKPTTLSVTNFKNGNLLESILPILGTTLISSLVLVLGSYFFN